MLPGDRHRPQGTRHRLPVADRTDGYHHAAWRVAVLAVRRARPIRASVDAGADHGGPGRRKAAGPTRWTTADDRRGKDAVASCRSVQWGQQSDGFSHVQRAAINIDGHGGADRGVSAGQGYALKNNKKKNNFPSLYPILFS